MCQDSMALGLRFRPRLRRKGKPNRRRCPEISPLRHHRHSACQRSWRRLRSRFAPKVEEAGGKMTVTAIALKICASALKIFSQFNASIDMEKEEIVYKQYFNIGVAVDTERGLLVPVIRDVDKKNIVELAV